MGRKGSGVEVRESSIRIAFVYNGETCRERLMVAGAAMKPTPANIKYAHRLADEIKRAIALGRFTFTEFFPESSRAAQLPPNTFGAIADLWHASKGQLVESTKGQYATAIRFWKALFGTSTPMPMLTHQVLASKIGCHPWPSAKAHNNYMIALRGIFEFEYAGARSKDNPLAGIKNLKVVKKLPDPLMKTERDRILTELRSRYDERVWAYFSFAFYTGMRPEEIIALRWSDIDYGRSMVRVQRVRTFMGSERDGSKTHTVRDVDLVDNAIEALKVMKSYTFLKGEDPEIFERPGWRPEKGSLGGKPVEAGPWHDERSQRDQFWHPTLKRLGIRRRPAYCTRHTYCTVALMAGVNPAYIALQAGHSVKMLLEKYARWIPGADGGQERRLLELAMGTGTGNSSQIPPNDSNKPDNLLIYNGNIGRHDWTRTNDPYHVKVVL